MTTRLLSVALCCNDDRGNTTDRVTAIHIDACDIGIELESIPARGVTLRFLEGAIRIAGKRFSCSDWRSWVGNIYWEQVMMSKTEVFRLLNWAHARGLFGLTAGPCQVCDAWDAGKRITARMVF